MLRKPQAPNWSRLARTARVEASKLPPGSARDAMIAKARQLEAAGKREGQSFFRTGFVPAFGEKKPSPAI